MRVAPLSVSQLKLGVNDYRITIERLPRSSLSMHVSLQELYVKAPLGSDQRTVLAWVATKQRWIEKRIALLQRMKLDPNEVWYLGRKTTVTSADQTNIQKNGIALKRGASFDAAMRKHAIEVISEIFELACGECGCRPAKLTYRTMVRSWGRCTSKGEITLNTRLIACDPRFIRYVCLHELAHLKYLNHSPAFWNEVKKFVPDIASVKKLSIVFNKQDLLAL